MAWVKGSCYDLSGDDAAGASDGGSATGGRPSDGRSVSARVGGQEVAQRLVSQSWTRCVQAKQRRWCSACRVEAARAEVARRGACGRVGWCGFEPMVAVLRGYDASGSGVW